MQRDQEGELVDLGSLLRVSDLPCELGQQERETVSEESFERVMEASRAARDCPQEP